MGLVVIVLPEIMGGAFLCLVQVRVFGQSNLLFLQAAGEALDLAVSFRVVVSRTAMGDPQPRQGLQEAGGSELRSIVGGEGQARFATARRKPLQDRPLDAGQDFLRPAAIQ
jgi:hypothetical protein